MGQFADWLSRTSLSLTIQTHEWIIPAVQSVHIVAIGITLASVLMVDLRVLGYAGRDQTLTETTARFGPWLWGALCVLLGTGGVMVVGEPVRELMAFSFWFKMTLVGVGASLAAVFQIALRRHRDRWDASGSDLQGIKWLAVLTLLIWVGIVILGRLIAYDHVWGSWSHSPKA